MSIRSALVVLGLIFVAIACVYWLVPASSLPAFVPGFEAGSPRVHVKHGVAALAAAVVCFIVAWFMGRSRLGRL
jgi:ammonia channel protein AmtB